MHRVLDCLKLDLYEIIWFACYPIVDDLIPD